MDVGLLLKIGTNLLRFRGLDKSTRDHIISVQSSSLARLRKHAIRKSSFYRKFHRGLEGRPLSDLPILTKPVVMDNFDDVVTDNRIKLKSVENYLAAGDFSRKFVDRYHVLSTSGSTGRRGIFLSDNSEWAAYMANLSRVFVWAGKGPSPTNKRKAAYITSTLPFTVSAHAAASVSRPGSKGLAIDTTEPFDQIIAKLNDWKPDVITTYASMAGSLAHEQLSGRLKIAPEIIVTAAEVLTQEIRNKVSRAWGDILFNVYGATEGAIGAECDRHTGLHVFEDCVIPEVVDAAGKPVPRGEYGERLLVTVLYRHTQPLIRYEISDMVKISKESCPCGRPFALIADVQGRREDVLYFPRTGGGEIAINPIFFEPILGPIRASAWQLNQEQDRLVLLFSGLAEDVSVEEVGDTLRIKLQSEGAIPPPIVVQRVDAIPRSATGKAPLIKSNRVEAHPS